MTKLSETRKSLIATALLSGLMIAGTAQAGLPDPGVDFTADDTALVVTDPQNDFLHEDGVAWGVVGESVEENNTIENLESLFSTAKDVDLPVFVSPHYYYPHDHEWHFGGALEHLMHEIGMFDRDHPLDTDNFDGSGADWHASLEPYIEDGKTVVTSPHKVYGPESNDLVLQLRKRGINKVILAGMSANLCTESHMRALVEAGFEVHVVSDATAAATLPDMDGHEAAMTNARMIANGLADTETTVEAMKALR
ncbi:cysteine hydrolase [Gammaproteobacteria bacterium AB-CW1]|uniref:Cysteine hydrolase n=1 Tax=Natronospira elongata TaxID=3110268 RepID=A0AAP6JGX6_9GAMM|nr:cysteine hydrolase [Gammaproteobacteria bacterium AB-CW1]